MSDNPPLVSIELLSSIARADGALYAGRILAVRADVAAAWIADGLARAVGGDGSTPAAPEAAMRPRSRARG
jgi:hypothetical protein